MTNAAGEFQFKEGDTVTFKLGGADGLEIVSQKPAADTPIFVGDIPAGTQIAQILQSFHTGGDLSSGIDVANIKAIPAAAKVALRNIIDTRTSLDGAVPAIATAIDQVWAAPENSILSSVAKPAPRTKAQVEAHLNTSAAKLPKVFPSFANESLITLEESTKDMTLVAFGADQDFYQASTHLTILSGQYKVNKANLSLTYQKNTIISTTPNTELAFSCVGEYTMTERITGGYKFRGGRTGDCGEKSDETYTTYMIDRGFSIQDFIGKTVILTEVATTGLSASPCSPITLQMKAGGTAEFNTTGCGNFTMEWEKTFDSAGHGYITMLVGDVGGELEAYMFVKLAGFENRYANLNFYKDGDMWKQQVTSSDSSAGRFWKITEQ